MSQLPSLKPYQVLKALQKAGFYVHHQTGSHVILKDTEDLQKRITLPMHNKDLKKGTLKSILKQVGISKEQFKKLL